MIRLACGKIICYNTLLSGQAIMRFLYYGWIPEWPKGADCKSVGDAFEGSNPSPSIKVNVMVRKESSWEKPKRFESFSIHSHY